MKFHVVKRTLMVDGARTSISLEAPFWRDLLEIATENELTLAELVSVIESNRDESNDLASAIRVHVLSHLRATLNALLRRGSGAPDIHPGSTHGLPRGQ